VKNQNNKSERKSSLFDLPTNRGKNKKCTHSFIDNEIDGAEWMG